MSLHAVSCAWLVAGESHSCCGRAWLASCCLTLRCSRPATAGFARLRRRLSSNVSPHECHAVCSRQHLGRSDHELPCSTSVRLRHSAGHTPMVAHRHRCNSPRSYCRARAARPTWARGTPLTTFRHSLSSKACWLTLRCTRLATAGCASLRQRVSSNVGRHRQEWAWRVRG